MSEQKNKLIYLSAIGILSYVIADIIHEVIGHGGTCLIIGNKIELLTAVYFKSRPGNIFIDIGGPISNLIFGALTFFILTKTSFAKLLLFQVAAYNLFWFSGTILHSAISKTGDWTFAINEIAGEPLGKLCLIVSGILVYTIIIKILNYYLKTENKEKQIEPLTKKSIFYSFVSALIAALLAGLFFKPDRLHSALEGLLEMTASLPILFLNFRKNSFNQTYKFKPNFFFGFTVFILYLVFCLTLGKGIS